MSPMKSETREEARQRMAELAEAERAGADAVTEGQIQPARDEEPAADSILDAHDAAAQAFDAKMAAKCEAGAAGTGGEASAADTGEEAAPRRGGRPRKSE